MTKFRILGIIFSLFALFALNSCKDDDVDGLGSAIAGPGTVYDIISRNGSSTSLEAALKVASGNLPETLSGSGSFTVFAPDDGAFAALATASGFETPEDLLANADPELLSQILTYHVVSGRIEAGNFSDGQTLTTVLGDELTVKVLDDGTVQILDATKLPETNPVSTVVQANGYADNGIVHFVDKVLVPQAAIGPLKIDLRPTIAEWTAGIVELDSLASYVEKAGLTATLMELDTARLLAPTNQALANLMDMLGDDYNDVGDFDNEAEIAVLGDVLKYHILLPADKSIELMAGPAKTALKDSNVDVVAGVAGFSFGDVTATNANTVTADIDARNGFVHTIDKVLLPQAALDFLTLLNSDDLATVVTDTPQLSILEEALIATGLVGDFMDVTNVELDAEAAAAATNFTYFRPATVFAPTDAAFTNLFDLLGADYTSIASFDTKEELELLKEILLNHVLAEKIANDDFTAGTKTTLSKNDIEVIAVLGTGGFVIGDATNNTNANIILPDVAARNGVAHVVDKVLLPKSAVDFIIALKAMGGN